MSSLNNSENTVWESERFSFSYFDEMTAVANENDDDEEEKKKHFHEKIIKKRNRKNAELERKKRAF